MVTSSRLLKSVSPRSHLTWRSRPALQPILPQKMVGVKVRESLSECWVADHGLTGAPLVPDSQDSLRRLDIGTVFRYIDSADTDSELPIRD